MSFFYEKEFLSILKDELIPAIGCTEPISVALAGAKAKAILPEDFNRITVTCSGSLYKNIQCAVVPNTGQLFGIEASVLAGVIGGDPNNELNVLENLNKKHIGLIKHHLEQNTVQVDFLETPFNLHFMVKLESLNHTVEIEIKHMHTNIMRITLDGIDIFKNTDQKVNSIEDVVSHHELLTFDRILTFVDQANFSSLKSIIEPQIIHNMRIAEEGLKGEYGVAIGKIIMDNNPSLYGKIKGYTAAASEARMCGCELPVVTNSGSGNQGIASSIPVILYATEKGISEEKMIRALALSNLLTIYQKGSIGRLSAFCGAIVACCSSGAAMTYLENGTKDQIKMTVINVLADSPGIICDGAKASCGCKIATGLEAAIIGHFISMENKSYLPFTGLIRKDVDDTISAIGRLATEGMKGTNKTIIDIMMEIRKK
jgi:L-cysteine desulfidase